MTALKSNRDIAVRLTGVSKTFGGTPSRMSRITRRTPSEPVKITRALDDVSVEVWRNEIFGILGANGSGKSTLIRLISTLLIADAGEISVFGLDVRKDEKQVKRLINRVSVEASFFKKLSPMENLLYSSRLYGRGGAQLRKDIRLILIELGIPADRIDMPLETMSRGMQQKVAIARAFLTSPVLLLLDEPTTGLDPRSKKEVQRFVEDLRDNHDATVLICSHDTDEAAQLCDRIAIMDNGKIVASGTVDELKRQVALQTGKFGPSMEDVYMTLTGHELTHEMAVASVA